MAAHDANPDRQVPRASGDVEPAELLEPSSGQEPLLEEILAQVRAGTGRDFRGSRRSTVLRQVHRRMLLHRLKGVDDYLAVLQADAAEVAALADDLLLIVSSGFFRERELYEALEREVIPRLFDGKGPEDAVRVWSVGCATGEEAYSLAILLLEEVERRGLAGPALRVFATDVHEPSLERAREGRYPREIEADVGEERLRRFFREDAGGYRVRPEVRKSVVFARHDVLRDPPYSGLDLVSCRNLLLSLQPNVQRDVIELFHYTLRPGGFLALTRPEASHRGDLFTALDDEPAVLRRSEAPSPPPRLPVLGPVLRESPPRPVAGGADAAPGALHQRLVERFAPPSLLVSPADRVMHVSEHAGRYLRHAAGEPSTRLDQMVRPELCGALLLALHEARERGGPHSTPPIALALDGGVRLVVAHVRPALEGDEEGTVLVLFEERASPELEPGTGETEAGHEGAALEDGGARRLEADLEWTRAELSALRTEHEQTEQELSSANEELQLSNVELRSMLEKLETREEELRSLNEELLGLAEERRTKAEELEVLSGDLQRLMAASEIGTLFLDRELRIVRYTPRIEQLFHALPSDVGRPLTDLKTRLRYDGLVQDARATLAAGEAQEREVEDDEARTYLVRLLPHWSLGGDVDGVVVVFVDITTRKRLAQAQEESRVKSQFLSTMSHELRTPLTAVIGLAELMETEVLGPMNERQKLNLGRIKRSAWHLVGIIEEVLSYARAEAGKETVRLTEVDLARVAREVVGMVEPTAEPRGIATSLDVADGLAPLRSDAGMVTRIATNLVGNAVKFARSHVEVALVEDGSWVELRVRDDGPGIPADRMETIFEPFTQLDGSSTREKGGTGLGLTIARRYARLLGGEVSVESTLGVGSTFTLRLPRDRPRPEGMTA